MTTEKLASDPLTSEQSETQPESSSSMAGPSSQPVYQVTRKQLPACCPPRDQAQWNLHPRVYFDFKKAGSANCPYCGNRFELIDD
ncbi:zinc-finger domain-containing protein [Aliikangiella maris]|uniref:Zinc-finger domain-containing protein n=2 Tax=Aliikangiella maris TaxID=3162458 RepID=A0ABV2BRP0_9GAMM